MHKLLQVVQTALLLSALLVAGCGNPASPRPPEPLRDARQTYENGTDAFAAGRYQHALRNFQESERRFRSIDDALGIATAAVSQTEAHLLLSQHDRAHKSLQRAFGALDRMDNEPLRSRAQLLLARLNMEADPATARSLLETLGGAPEPVATQARIFLCEMAVRSGNAGCVKNLEASDPLTTARLAQLRAHAAIEANEHAVAVAQLDAALAIYREKAYRPGIASVHETLGRLHAGNDATESAIRHLRRALYLRLWMEDNVNAAEDLRKLAALSDDPQTRERYLRWRKDMLNDSADTEWSKILDEIFRPR